MTVDEATPATRSVVIHGNLPADNDVGEGNLHTESDRTPSNHGHEEAPSAVPSKKVRWYRFEGVGIAEGYNWVAMARGALIMANVFLSNAFVFLASEQAGCLDDEGHVEKDCREKVYGFYPASFVSNIAVISGVISALFMPLLGAIVDYTEYRRAVGIFSAALMIMIHIVQIGTVLPTWLPMALLQAINGFFYQVQIVAAYAYLPDMSYIVGHEKMTRYTSTFTMSQFGSEASFVVLITALSVGLGLNEVVTGQVSQAINSLWSGALFVLGWRLMENVKPKHVLPEGHSLLREGFLQVYHTAKNINTKYKNGWRWFFLSVIFASSGANSFTTVSVVFLTVQIGMSGTEIGVFFLVTLLGTIPGSQFASCFVTPRINPKRSLQYCLIGLTIWTTGGAIVVNYTPIFVVYVWGVGVGVFLGWYYPTEGLFYSIAQPQGQETELSGFYIYCSQILSWLPPLLFSIMVQADISQTYAVAAVMMFFPIACVILVCAGGWEDILKECGRLEHDESALRERTVFEDKNISNQEPDV